MRIVAILAVHNEERFLERNIRHLVDQGVSAYIIDNESEDRTPEIARRRLGNGVIRMETFRREGVFDHEGLLVRKQQISSEIDADWFIHLDADTLALYQARVRAAS